MTHTTQAGLRAWIAAIFAEDGPFVGIGKSSYEKADRVIAMFSMPQMVGVYTQTTVGSGTRLSAPSAVHVCEICDHERSCRHDDPLQTTPPALQETTTEVEPVEGAPDFGASAFADYFRRNYPGPDTIITNPDWHAPRIYRAAVVSYLAGSPPPSAAPTDNTALVDAAKDAADDWEECLSHVVSALGHKPDWWGNEVAKIAAFRAALASRPAAPRPDTDVAAENKRLREALERILELKPDRERPQDYNRGWQDGRYQVRIIARAALTDPANNRSAGERNDG